MTREARHQLSPPAKPLVLFLIFSLVLAPSLMAQETDTEGPQPEQTSEVVPTPADNEDDNKLDFFSLLIKGGWFMVPIGIMSALVVTFGIERAIGLRRSRVIPLELVRGLGTMGSNKATFDPRTAYQLCQQFPSAASNVIRAMLLKVGRPHSEVEHTVSESSQREADRLYSNCRVLNLAATITPLIGLAGTVWGMIDAFHGTTQLDPHASKAEHLAEGIYLALVTTLAGLFVAIPAATTSHYYEGRIRTMFHEISELMFNLMPHIERFEGRVRFSRQIGDEGASDSSVGEGGDGGSESMPAASSAPS